MANNSILIIEDTWQVRNLLQKIVKHIFPNYAVIGVDSCLEAIAVIDEQTPSLIITDLDMPEFNGYDLMAHLHRQPRTRTIPVIIVSSYADRSNDSAIEYRLDDMGLPRVPVVAKPLDIADFRAKVAGALTAPAI